MRKGCDITSRASCNALSGSVHTVVLSQIQENVCCRNNSLGNFNTSAAAPRLIISLIFHMLIKKFFMFLVDFFLKRFVWMLFPALIMLTQIGIEVFVPDRYMADLHSETDHMSICRL